MKVICGLLLGLGVTANAFAGQTITATFENYAAGASFQPSFTDPLSGITFRNSTHPPVGGFTIDGSDHYFGGGKYLTAGGGPVDILGAFFGFTADLPAPSNYVSLEALYGGDFRSNVKLQGFNAAGEMIAQTIGPSGGSSDPFTLTITSSQFDIKTFRVSVGSGAAGYDNISFVVPEPAAAIWGLAFGGVLRRRR